MKGKILDFNAATSQGVIAGEDGKRYNFNGAEWKSEGSASNGLTVDFVVNDENATQIYFDKTISSASSKKIAAALLAFFFGTFGVQKFYLGYNKAKHTARKTRRLDAHCVRACALGVSHTE